MIITLRKFGMITSYKQFTVNRLTLLCGDSTTSALNLKLEKISSWNIENFTIRLLHITTVEKELLKKEFKWLIFITDKTFFTN